DIPPQKITGTDAFSFLGLTVSYSVNHLGDPSRPTAGTPVIMLAGPHTSLAVISSNVDYLRPSTYLYQSLTVPQSGPITITFNEALNPSSVRVQFLAEDALTVTQVQPTAAVQTNVLTITPTSPLQPGARFNVLIHA